MKEQIYFYNHNHPNHEKEHYIIQDQFRMTADWTEPIGINIEKVRQYQQHIRHVE